MFEEFEVEIINYTKKVDMSDMLCSTGDSPLSIFFSDRWKKNLIRAVTFKIKDREFVLLDISNPNYWRIYSQYVAFKGNCWTFANMVAVFSLEKAVDFLKNVKNNEEYPMKIKIT